MLFKVKMITLKYEDYGKKIWTPDTFIVNSVKGNRHDIVEPNNYLRIFPMDKFCIVRGTCLFNRLDYTLLVTIR